MLDLQGGYDVDCSYALTEIGAARIISDIGRVHSCYLSHFCNKSGPLQVTR
jgi:hypothetical protein